MKRQDWEEVADQFKRRANFPMCLGAIDGKHIRVQNFPHAGSVHFNYKKFYSIVLLAIADANYKFVYVDIGAYGKDCDSSILQSTDFWKRLTLGELDIPQSKGLPPKGIKVPYVFIGDSAFAIHEHILKEFSNNNMSVKQRVFNYRLHRARRYVECAFGILSNKWRIFHRPLNVSKKFSKNIVKACVVLHNIVRSRDVGGQDDEIIVPGSQFRNLIRNTKQTGKTGKGVRTIFANYFVSDEGKLPWQLSKI
uniref:DDE Tnp4 domain-containing protein n=1 Tax=Cuerna arida TaxID=1464854 RepID=A0A1B6H4T8_9HEMI